MGPISPINIGSAGSAYAPPSIPEGANYAAGVPVAGGLGLDAVQGGAMTSSVAQISAAVSELFKSIGGGVENDQMLRTLIVLLVLMALLEKPQANGTAASSALNQLGNGSGGSQFLSVASSSTTIEIQQSSTTIVSANLDTLSSSSKSQVPPLGGQIDMLS